MTTEKGKTMTPLEKEMAKLAAQGITVSVKLAPGVPDAESPAALIRDAAKTAGIHYGDEGERR